MAEVSKNVVTKGLTGKLGDDIVFRQVNGKTIVAAAPVKRTIEGTAGQKQQQRKFKEAVVYAKNAMQDVNLKAMYTLKAKKGLSPFNAALADYLNAPNIEEVDTSPYKGVKGNPILVKALDNYEVTQVIVSVFLGDGTLVEEGTAQLAENGLDWVYATQKANATLSGSKVLVKASDVPGNFTEKEVVV